LRAKQLILVVAGLLFTGAIVLGLVVALWLPGYIEREAMRQIRERGLELSSYELEYGFGWVKLTNARGKLVDVKNLELSFKSIDVELDGQEPERIDLAGVGVQATGSAPTLALELAAWSKRFPQSYALPLWANGVDVVWRPQAGAAPWLEIAGGSIAKNEATTIVSADQVKVAGTPVGKVGASWSATASAVAIGLGEPELAKAPVKVEVAIGDKPKVTFRLAPTRLEKLAGPFGVALPVENVTASGQVELNFPSQLALAPADGSTHIELEGWIPPHPVELDGFVFGNVTTFDSKLAISEDLKTVTLTDAAVKAGKFELKGGGTIAREEGHALAKLAFAGNLPCPALAGAAAESRLGYLLGRVAGKLAGAAARQLVEGSVAVEVRIAADTRQLKDASVERRIGIGCGLKPLTLEELKKLSALFPVPPELSALADEIAKLPPPDLASLPPLPGTPALPAGSALPPASSFPKLPTLPSALPTLPRIEIDFGKGESGATKKVQPSGAPSAASSAK
jgi:hypothetical protein